MSHLSDLFYKVPYLNNALNLKELTIKKKKKNFKLLQGK